MSTAFGPAELASPGKRFAVMQRLVRDIIGVGLVGRSFCLTVVVRTGAIKDGLLLTAPDGRSSSFYLPPLDVSEWETT